MKTKGKFESLLMLIVMCLITMTMIAQSATLPALERRISISASNRRAQEVLKEIEEKAGCTFSYQTKLIPEDKLVSVSVQNRSVREALDKMFAGKIQGKAKGQHIILSKAPEEVRVISGYVENSKGEAVSGASVYDANTMSASTTDEYGYYEMKIRRNKPIELAVSKSSYLDTLVPVQTSGLALHNITLEEEKKDTTLKFVMNVMKDTKDSLVSAINDAGLWAKRMLMWSEGSRNITDTLHRPFQISFVPFAGTNGLLSGNVVNDWSVNIIGGYNRGVKKAEFAGLFNVDREDVGVAQFAGFTNIVGGNLNGLQAAGFANITLGEMHGAQIAGFANINAGAVTGLQAGGFANVCLGETDGVQLAGFGNIAVKNIKGPQIAGAFNLAADEIDGAQISGLLNVARKVNGSQIGVFNFADSLSGIPIGLLSFVRNGYHKLEFSYDELSYGHIAFRTGVQHFYNIVTAGVYTDMTADTVNWTFGYGLGCAPRITNKTALNFDLTANQVVYGNVGRELNQFARLYVGVDYNFLRQMSITAGVTLNAHFTENGAVPLPGSENRHIVYTHQFDSQYGMKSWIGWSVGVRFF